MQDIHGEKSTITTSNDKRITSLGRIMRLYKIDELPQLINVINGSMSFVGPRPDVEGFADKLEGKEKVILSIRPGITGPATLKYRNEEELLSNAKNIKETNDQIYRNKVKINIEYINNWSLIKDIGYKNFILDIMNFLRSFLIKLIALSRFNKQLIVIISDCLIAIVCIRLSLVTRYETFNFSQENEFILYILAILIFLPIFSYFKIYKIIHQYLGLSSLGQIFIASATSGVVFFSIILLFQIPYIPRSIGVIFPILFTTIILLSRIIIIYLINESINVINLKNVIIFGAGDIAINAAKVLERSPNYKLKCFIDHKNQNLGKLINNILIYPPKNLEILIKKFHINIILVATENFDQKTINKLVTRIEKYNIEIIKIPKSFNILDDLLLLAILKN